ncbi:MAG: hypothetical protein ACXWJW_08705 [Xanthobacteraceae bacterium]
MTDATFVVHCHGCGDCRAVVAEEIDEDVELHEIAQHVVHCLKCVTCGEDTLEIHPFEPSTIH